MLSFALTQIISKTKASSSMEKHLTKFLFFLLLLLFTTLPKSHVATTDSLFPNQTLVVGRTLISQNQVFELGFFSPGRSENRFLGIWYKSTPGVCVWVANRNDPINSNSEQVFLSIVENRTLVVGEGGSIIWSSANASTVASSPVLQLLNTGNLVMIDRDSPNYIWESFDYPTDTWLPGMKLVDDPDSGRVAYLTSWKNWDDPSSGEYVHKIQNDQGLPEAVVIHKGKVRTYRTGNWNGLGFCGIMPLPSPIFRPEMIFKEDKLISMMEPYDSSVVRRIRLSPSGETHQYAMNAKRDDWKPIFTLPRDFCDRYGQCGPNSICRAEMAVVCECMKGFTPKIPEDWELQDWSGGCTRTKELNCHNGNGFLEVSQLKHPEISRYWLNTSMSLLECRDECLRNCSCTAYANPYVTNGGYGCLMWFGDLIDVRHLYIHAEAYSTKKIYIRLSASELDSGKSLHLQEKETEKKTSTKLVLISIAAGVLVSGFINRLLLLVARKKGRAGKTNEKELEVPVFKLDTIAATTNNFSEDNIIGKGGFGPVYKGILPEKEEIAVKRLSSSSSQGLEEFKNEVNLIAKLQHRNLIRLLGCCIDGEERILIYEYLHNKSLDYFLFDQSQRTLLTWPKRFDIIMGIARGILYLHQDSRLKVIHRDLKASNILLDRDLIPKIADFGIARSFGEDQCTDRTKRVVGTYGYMAPEYAIAGNFSVKSDVFSMGVVLLEIVSGIRNRGFDHRDQNHTLLGHVWLLWKENRIMEMMDECLKDTYVESEVKRIVHVGLLCVQCYAEDRPSMSSVIPMLSTDGSILAEPKEPGFFANVRKHRTPRTPVNSSSMTITDLEAR